MMSGCIKVRSNGTRWTLFWWAYLVAEVNLHYMIVLEAILAEYNSFIVTANNDQEGTVFLDASLGLRGCSWVATKNIENTRKRIRTPDETRDKDRNYEITYKNGSRKWNLHMKMVLENSLLDSSVRSCITKLYQEALQHHPDVFLLAELFPCVWHGRFRRTSKPDTLSHVKSDVIW
jgi:hypothetical protein